MLNKLDLILLSNNASVRFFDEYEKLEFKEWINKIIPQVELCVNQKQDNPWHIYDCMTHILKSVEEINKLTLDLKLEERRMLAYIMFLHDIGKPDCYIRRFSKQYGREVDSFFNHNKKSVEIAYKCLPELGFCESEIKVITKLIDKHDIFMFIRENPNNNPFHRKLSQQLIDEEIEDLNRVGNGRVLLKYLILIGKADNLAQNPTMTGESLALLSKMWNMVN